MQARLEASLVLILTDVLRTSRAGVIHRTSKAEPRGSLVLA
jgi:hypothetical protein